MNIGIDHGYYAIKTRHCSFPAGITAYGSQEPYTRRNLLEFGGNFYLCGTGRQPLQKDKTQTDSYYLLTLAAIAQELKARCAPPECSITIAAGLPLTSFGRDKEKFTAYHRGCAAVSAGVCRCADRTRSGGRRAVPAGYGHRRLDGGSDAHRQRRAQRGHLPQPFTRSMVIPALLYSF